MHPTSLNKMKAFVEEYLEAYKGQKLKILDVGSKAIAGQQTYRPFFNNPNWIYLELDLEKGENVDIVVKDPYKWDEVEDSSVDMVISGQAFEHIEFPWLTIKEIFRVLKDKGLACIIAPSSGPEHRYPV
ncbi:MAG: methyltransferase domain-containing protein, partial [Thermoplasmata archaeon]